MEVVKVKEETMSCKSLSVKPVIYGFVIFWIALGQVAWIYFFPERVFGPRTQLVPELTYDFMCACFASRYFSMMLLWVVSCMMYQKHMLCGLFLMHVIWSKWNVILTYWYPRTNHFVTFEYNVFLIYTIADAFWLGYMWDIINPPGQALRGEKSEKHRNPKFSKVFGIFVMVFETVMSLAMWLKPTMVFGNVIGDVYQNGAGDGFTDVLPLYAGVANWSFACLCMVAQYFDGYQLQWWVVVWSVRLFTDLQDTIGGFFNAGGNKDGQIVFILFCVFWVVCDVIAMMQVLKKLKSAKVNAQ